MRLKYLFAHSSFKLVTEARPAKTLNADLIFSAPAKKPIL